MVGTFSKALGGLGGFVAGDGVVIANLVHQARSLLYTTAPPPAQLGAALAGLEVIQAETWRRERLHRLCADFRAHLAGLGFTLLSEEGPIVPVLVGEAHQSVAMAEALLRQGVLAPAMRPPTVPENTSRIRLTVTAAHGEEELELAARALQQAAEEIGL